MRKVVASLCLILIISSAIWYPPLKKQQKVKGGNQHTYTKLLPSSFLCFFPWIYITVETLIVSMNNYLIIRLEEDQWTNFFISMLTSLVSFWWSWLVEELTALNDVTFFWFLHSHALLDELLIFSCISIPSMSIRWLYQVEPCKLNLWGYQMLISMYLVIEYLYFYQHIRLMTCFQTLGRFIYCLIWMIINRTSRFSF